MRYPNLEGLPYQYVIHSGPLLFIFFWCQLILSINLTLNLLRSSNLHPQLLAHAALVLNFDYNYTLLIPPGTRALLLNPANKRPSFGIHQHDGW